MSFANTRTECDSQSITNGSSSTSSTSNSSSRTIPLKTGENEQECSINSMNYVTDSRLCVKENICGVCFVNGVAHYIPSWSLAQTLLGSRSFVHHRKKNIIPEPSKMFFSQGTSRNPTAKSCYNFPPKKKRVYQAMEQTPRPHDSHPKTSSSSYGKKHKQNCLQSESRKSSPCTEKAHTRIW